MLPAPGRGSRHRSGAPGASSWGTRQAQVGRCPGGPAPGAASPFSARGAGPVKRVVRAGSGPAARRSPYGIPSPPTAPAGFETRRPWTRRPTGSVRPGRVAGVPNERESLTTCGCASAPWDIGGADQADTVLPVLPAAWENDDDSTRAVITCLDRMGPAALPALPPGPGGTRPTPPLRTTPDRLRRSRPRDPGHLPEHHGAPPGPSPPAADLPLTRRSSAMSWWSTSRRS